MACSGMRPGSAAASASASGAGVDGVLGVCGPVALALWSAAVNSEPADIALEVEAAEAEAVEGKGNAGAAMREADVGDVGIVGTAVGAPTT